MPAVLVVGQAQASGLGAVAADPVSYSDIVLLVNQVTNILEVRIDLGELGLHNLSLQRVLLLFLFTISD